MKTPTKIYNLLIASMFMLISSFSLAQSQWETYAEVEGVQIQYTEVECREEGIPPQLAVIIKVVNTTNSNITIEWDLAIWYNDELASENIADDENHMTITLKPNQSIEGDCSVPHGTLYIYKDFLVYKAKQKLTKFELQNIRVTLQ